MIPPPYPLFEVVANAVELVTPFMKRVTFDAAAIASSVRGQPTEWLKVHVPGTGAGRAYTIRNFARTTGMLELDFVLHGDHGAVSSWASRATVGARFAVSQPHPRSGFVWPAGVHDHLLFGDETALPAIGALLGSLTSAHRAQVFVALNDRRAAQRFDSAADVSLTWLDGDLSAAAARALRPSAVFDVWAAGESSAVKALRTHFRQLGVRPEHLHATGYWKHGAPDFRDEEA